MNAVQLLAEQEKIDPDRIFVQGHSLGGNAIPAIAQELFSDEALIMQESLPSVRDDRAGFFVVNEATS